MKTSIAALIIAQSLAAAPPAFAADFAAVQEQRAGAFGGFRLRMPLGGEVRARQVRAGFALAPTLSSRTGDSEIRTRIGEGLEFGFRSGDSEIRTRIGEGLEFGFRSGRPLSFSLAGQDLNRRRLGAAPGDGGNDAVPRVALAVAGVVLTLGLLYWGFTEAIDCDAEEECS